jgi:intracellular septation protein
MNKGNHSWIQALSFLPALAYWWLESTQPLHIALGVGMGLGLLEAIIEKVFTGKVHTLSRLNLGLLVLLGGLALWEDEGVWFKLQPTFTGLVCGSYLSWRLWQGKPLLAEAMYDMGQTLPVPPSEMASFEKHLCCFMLSYSAFMAYWALWGTTSQWAFWKTGGQYLSFGAFMVVELWWMRRRMKGSNA